MKVCDKAFRKQGIRILVSSNSFQKTRFYWHNIISILFKLCPYVDVDVDLSGDEGLKRSLKYCPFVCWLKFCPSVRWLKDCPFGFLLRFCSFVCRGHSVHGQGGRERGIRPERDRKSMDKPHVEWTTMEFWTSN